MRLRRGFRVFSVSIAVLLAAYFTWARFDRVRPPLDVRLQLEESREIDTFRGKGNIIGISPWMIPSDYASRQHLLNKLDGYLQVAKTLGWIHPGTTVVFPEHIGTLLIIEGEKSGIFRAATIDDALALFVGSNYFYYLREWFTAPDGTINRTRHSIFSIKSASMSRSYQEVFSSLARKYSVTVVAGSILLSNPSVKEGQLQTDMGPLSNVGAVFHPDGHIDPTLYAEAHPASREAEFVKGVRSHPHPSFALPAGPTTILLSDDAWHPEYFPGTSDSRQIILTPEFFSPDSALSKPWENVERPGSQDVPLTLQSALNRYGWPSSMLANQRSVGMLVPLRGRLWDIGSDGGIIVKGYDTVHFGAVRRNASMLNLNLR